MWNWLVSGLATGCTLVLYDGSPMHPRADFLMDMVDAERITVFGTSARYIAALQKAGVKPNQTHQLTDLRAILSTGSPLSDTSFDYVYASIKRDLCLSSISGGTDIISCFALGNPNLPVHRGELQCRGLGMNVSVFDEAGQPVVQQKGELVCTSAFPSMPIHFWNDPHGDKYHRAYFDRFPGVWCHGDYTTLTEHGGLIIYGRSDATLNPGGVRIGTAEIYRQVDQLSEVVESVVIGQSWSNDVRVVLFVRLRDEMILDDALIDRIKKEIRDGASPRHVPAKVIQVADIPRTRSGKTVELAVREAVHGRPVKNIEALANPEALQHFRNLAELKES
jgi:acetoacetyl-CoA synthetase